MVKKYSVEDMEYEFALEQRNKTLSQSNPWPAPAAGQVTLSVDGWFYSDGTTSSGMILRNSGGGPIFAAYVLPFLL